MVNAILVGVYGWQDLAVGGEYLLDSRGGARSANYGAAGFVVDTVAVDENPEPEVK